MEHRKLQHKKHWEIGFLVDKVQEESLMHWKQEVIKMTDIDNIINSSFPLFNKW